MKSKTITFRPNAPWFTEELHLAKVEKRKWERLWIRTKLEVHKQIFKDYSRRYYSIIEVSKTNYYRDNIKACDHSVIFTFIRKNLGSANSCPVPETLSADYFNNFFVDKILTIRSTLDRSVDISMTANDTNHADSGLQEIRCSTTLNGWQTVSINDVRNIIKNSPCKSCCSDPLPARLFKECCEMLLPTITQIINNSLAAGVVPTSFKYALVTPIIKSATLDPDQLSNYRPISNLRFLSKVLERAVNCQLQVYLQTKSL